MTAATDPSALDPAEMTVDEALTTTRAVRKRLDLTRPVPRDLILECLQLAFQAPNGSNQQMWGWVCVDDPATRALSVAPAVYLGRVSYALYLIQLTPLGKGLLFPVLPANSGDL